MATQVSPGVRITEVDNTLTTAQAPSAAAAIGGLFRWGPVEQVRTVSSEDELVQVFGKPDSLTANYFFTGANYLAYGNTLRVVRTTNTITGRAATSGAKALSDTLATELFSVNTTSKTLTRANSSLDLTTVLYPGYTLLLSSASVTTPVRVTVASVTTANATLVSIPTSAVTNGTATAYGAQVKNSDQYEMSFAAGTNGTGMWAAKYMGALGNGLRVALCANSVAYENSYARATANLTVGSGGVLINVSSDVTGTIAVGDIITANAQSRQVLGINSSTLTVNTAFSGTLANAAFSAKWAYKDLFSGAPGTSDYALNLGGSLDELHVVVVDEEGLFTGVANSVLEIYPFLSKASDAKNSVGSSNYYKDVINRQSPYIWWMAHPTNGATDWGSAAAGVTFGSVANQNTSLFGGVDGNVSAANADIIRAYDTMLPEQYEVAFVLGGPANATVAQYLLSSIIGVKKFAMAFLSPLYDNVVNQTGSEATNVLTFRNSLNLSTSYAVLDSGWKYQYDKYNDVYRYVPLNGDVAGCAARTDQVNDPWFSPAGFTRGQIKNVVKLAWNPNQSQRDALYMKGVNPVVTFPGQGTVLYGDKTLLEKPSAFDRINVRRLFINLQQVIDRAAQQLLFEQNDEFSRNTFINLVEPYLREVKGRRGITDFVVVCDETNNPPSAVDRNEFRGDIYVKPVRSINFIQLNVTAVRSDVAFSEIVTTLQ